MRSRPDRGWRHGGGRKGSTELDWHLHVRSRDMDRKDKITRWTIGGFGLHLDMGRVVPKPDPGKIRTPFIERTTRAKLGRICWHSCSSVHACIMVVFSISIYKIVDDNHTNQPVVVMYRVIQTEEMLWTSMSQR